MVRGKHFYLIFVMQAVCIDVLHLFVRAERERTRGISIINCFELTCSW